MKNLNFDLYKKLYLARTAEEGIIKEYLNDEMKTPMHMSMGSEAIVIGICHALAERGQFFGTYRTHALYLTVTEETDTFFAEMYGKATGRAKGKAGSMHLTAPDKGVLAASAVVASTIPAAIGAAFANQYQENYKLVVAFFGDGAIDEGNFWESLNMACLLKLPIIFVCEDNDLAVHNPKRNRHGYDSIARVVEQFNCHVFESDTTDVEEIHTIAERAVRAIDETPRPVFLHLHYYRYLEHVGINQDFDAGYRDKKVYDSWRKRDPLDLQRNKLLTLGIDETELVEAESAINTQIEKSIQFAKDSPFADTQETYTDIFCE